jgi:hypothetical protein
MMRIRLPTCAGGRVFVSCSKDLLQREALLEAMCYSTSTATGDAANVGRWSSYGIFLRKYNHLAQLAAPLLSNRSLIDTFDLTKVRSSSNTVWPQQKENFELAYANASLLKSLLEGEIGYAADETIDSSISFKAICGGQSMKSPKERLRFRMLSRLSLWAGAWPKAPIMTAKPAV